jgi:DNA-binding NarL/FixJ family response regulator
MNSAPITLLLVEDHTLVRQVWDQIFNSDPRFTVAGACSTGEEAIELALSLRPDVILMDINLPGMSGIDATEQIRKQMPNARILGISMQSQPVYARRMIEKGALGYLTKNSPRQEMYQAILEIYSGRKYLCNEIKTNLAEQMLLGEKTDSGLGKLTKQEWVIIGLLKQGYTTKEMAAQLDVTNKTIEVHRYNILKKLNLKNSAQLVQYIHQNSSMF